MFKGKLEQSPHWDEYKEVGGFVQEGFPFNEGFPMVPYKSRDFLRVDPFWFMIITRDGKRHIAAVDSSLQHRAEGLNWRTYHPKRDFVYPHTVVAWKELEESDLPSDFRR